MRFLFSTFAFFFITQILLSEAIPYTETHFYLESEELDENAFFLDENMSLSPITLKNRYFKEGEASTNIGNIFFILAKSDGFIEVTTNRALHLNGILVLNSIFIDDLPYKDPNLPWELENSTEVKVGKNELKLTKGLNVLRYFAPSMQSVAPALPGEEKSNLPSNNLYLTISDPNGILSYSLRYAYVTSAYGEGSVSDGGLAFVGESYSVTATAKKGWLFSHWSGDGDGNSNPYESTIGNENASIIANFIEDTNDDDGDGLTNYEETRKGTLIDNKDTDSDGLLDGDEVALGFSPIESNTEFLSKLIQAIEKNPLAFNISPINIVASQDANATPYTNNWFFLPSLGWIWNDKNTFPYFYNASDENWMFFEAGSDIPRFYSYKAKEWFYLD